MRPALMLIGGTDPSGGAGLAADILSAAAAGVHGCPVVTSITVQNSGNILSHEPVAPTVVRSQMDAVFSDGPVGAVKSGMLGSGSNAAVLADALRGSLSGIPYVLDPVLLAGGGGRLADREVLTRIREDLLPLCNLCTPNLHEAGVLSGIEITDEDGMVAAGEKLMQMGAGAVLVKGGHLPDEPVDILVSHEGNLQFRGSRITSNNVHGTGCSLGTTVAAFTALGFCLTDAVREARLYVRGIIGRSFRRVHGILPGHFPKAGPIPTYADSDSFYSPPRYCASCGSLLGRSPAEEGHLFCSSCGYIHYRNPLPAVALLVRRGNDVLLVRRAVPPRKDMLSLPGGFMELGETPFQCGKRELMEETGIEIQNCRLGGIETDTTPYGGILLVCIEVTEWSGEPIAGDDASETLWQCLDDMPVLAFEAHDRLVQKWSAQLSSVRVLSSDS